MSDLAATNFQTQSLVSNSVDTHVMSTRRLYLDGVDIYTLLNPPQLLAKSLPPDYSQRFNTKELVVSGGAVSGHVLAASDNTGKAKWVSPASFVGCGVEGPSTVTPGTLPIFRNSRKMDESQIRVDPRGWLVAPGLQTDKFRMGQPKDGQVLVARNSEATWVDDPHGADMITLRDDIDDMSSTMSSVENANVDSKRVITLVGDHVAILEKRVREYEASIEQAKVQIARLTRLLPSQPGVDKQVLTYDNGRAEWRNAPDAGAGETPPRNTVETLYVESDECIIRGGSVLLATNSRNSTVILGKQATNIGAGDGALASLLDGDDIIGIGQDALTLCIDGHNNVALGPYTLTQYTQSEATAIGARALMRCTTGSGNTACGYSALQSLETGSYSTAFGHNCAPRSVGSANTFVGAGACIALTHGNGNSVLGTGACEKLITGSNACAFGDGSGCDGDFTGFIAIGKNARAQCDGDLAIASRDVPMRTSRVATNGPLSVLGPIEYLCVTLNGASYKIALYEP